MSLFRKRNAGESVNPVYLIIAAIVMPFVEVARWCSDKAYSGWKGAIVALLGFVVATGSGIAGGHYAADAFHLGGFLNAVSGLAAFLAVMFYAWPLAWRFLLSPVWQFCEAVYDRAKTYTERYSAGFFGFFVKVASTICVGSKGAWDTVLSKEHQGSWFASLLAIMTGLVSFGGSAYLGWNVYEQTLGAVHLPVANQVVAIAAGMIAFSVVGGLLKQFLTYGKMAYLGVLISGVAVWGVAPYVVPFTGLTGYAVYGVEALAFIVTLGYLFPFANLLLTNGFWEQIWKFVKPLPEKTYDDSDKKYSEFFHHLVNLTVTAGTTGGAYFLASNAGAPVWAIVPIAAVTAALTYIVNFKLINHEGGNFIVGGVLSIAAAVAAGVTYTNAGLIYGLYGGIVAAVVALLVTGVVAFPVAYLVLRGILRTIGASGLADPLTSLYTSANEAFKKGLKEVRHAYDNCYRDKSAYKSIVIHVTNIGVAYAACVATIAAVGAAHTSPVLGGAAVVLATALSYILVGKLLQKVGYGLEFIGGVASAGAAFYVGTLVYGTAPSTLLLVASIASGIATWFASFFIAIPVAYVVARFLTGWALNGWLAPLLEAVHGFAWSCFATVWKGFNATYKWLWNLTAPIRRALAQAWSGVAEQYKKLLRIIRGR